MRTLNDIHGASDEAIDSYLGDVSAADFRRHVAEFSGERKTLRDWFAGMALQESIRLCAKADKEQSAGTVEEYVRMATSGEDDINSREALMAYAFADAMLAARKEKP